MPHDVLTHKVGFIYQNEQESKKYQCNMFENVLRGTLKRARMCRGNQLGNLRDSWEYTQKGKLKSYTTYKAYRILDVHDTGKLVGENLTKLVFLTGTWDNKVLNHIFQHLSNTNGIMSPLNQDLLESPFGPRYHTDFTS